MMFVSVLFSSLHSMSWLASWQTDMNCSTRLSSALTFSHHFFHFLSLVSDLKEPSYAMLCQAQKLRSLKLKQYEACWNHPAISSSSSGSMWQPQLRPPFLSLGFAVKPACQMCLRQTAAQDFTIFYCGEKDVKVLERLLQHRGRMAKFTND